MNIKYPPQGRPYPLLLLLSLALLYGSAAAQVERISLADDRSQANACSDQAAITDGGSVITFHSNADNLVAGDTKSWSTCSCASSTLAGPRWPICSPTAAKRRTKARQGRSPVEGVMKCFASR